MFKIDNELTCGYAQLNVTDLKEMTAYYSDKIGLDVISENEERIELGITETKNTLLVLNKTTADRSSLKAGLFHTAFLLPTRKDLGNILFSLLNKGVSVDGASDHGYSEAIYLQDPEGNGIEIYRDKPKKEWTINADGTIPGVTEEMDAEGVLKSRDDQPSDRFPQKTIIGHMHLSVRDLNASEAFYRNVLGLSLKYQFGSQARFLAAGKYHHHIGMNTWAGTGLAERTEEDLGLSLFSLNLSSRKTLQSLTDHLTESGHPFLTEADAVTLTDPNGIHVKVEYTGNE